MLLWISMRGLFLSAKMKSATLLKIQNSCFIERGAVVGSCPVFCILASCLAG